MNRRWGLLAGMVVGALAFAGTAGSGCVFYLNPLCTDMIHNGDETGIDCGGPCTARCEVGEGCRLDTDCDESMCTGGTCTPFPCNNGVHDGAETDIDCGGGECRKCAGGRICAVDADCFNGSCGADKTCTSLRTVSFADAVSYHSGDKTYVLFSGDVNADGKIDLVAANEQGNSLSVFLNDGAGLFQTPAPAFMTGAYPTGGTLADFNHDGILDVVTADYHGNTVSVLLGTGTGALGPKTSYATQPEADTSNLAVGDLNRDGNLDVVATNPQKASISVFLGHADGTLDPAVDIPIGIEGGYHPFSAAIGDFNSDGNPDVAVADIVTGPMVVMLGNGDGTFQPFVEYPAGGVGANIVIAADINLDGKLDLVIANRGASSVSVLLGRGAGHGDGTFSRRPITVSTGKDTGPYALAIADFNLDGVPDVVTPNFLNSTATVLLGTGDGHFEAAIDAGPTGRGSYGIASGDFNGDGKPDFATGNAVSNDVTVKMSTAQ